jgi:hypothetical protein
MDQDVHWFPAKRYGIGWGPPQTWQGWLVLAIYLLAESLCWLYWFPQQMRICVIVTGALTMALVAVCYLTGEPLGWRWGR